MPKSRKGVLSVRGKWMLEARLSLGVHPLTGNPWTQAQLAEALGWHATTVSGYETARDDAGVPDDAVWAVYGFTGYGLPGGFTPREPR